MTPELEKKLYMKYPKIFERKDLGMNQTCMCWGIAVDDGWYNIIDILCSQIQHYLDWENCEGQYESQKKWRTPNEEGSYEKVPQLFAEQVKEKFGTLRFYTLGGDDYTRGLVDMAEAMTARVCETCGAPGRTTKGGWVKTLCPEHASESGRTTELEGDDEDAGQI